MGFLMPERDKMLIESYRAQLEYFTSAHPRCRGLQLPEGIMLRYHQEHSLYFYLRTRMDDGKIITQVYGTDSPYDMQKSQIGEVKTPLFDVMHTHQFDPDADRTHLTKLEKLVNDWVDFISEAAEEGDRFSSFHIAPNLMSRAAY
jgi:hypothetical protein